MTLAYDTGQTKTGGKRLMRFSKVGLYGTYQPGQVLLVPVNDYKMRDGKSD